MAFIAPMNKMAATVDEQADPDVIVVSQTVICPMGTPPGDDPAPSGGTHAYGFVA
jgi:hypothetical protein